jgi:Cys-tRNA(Pro)/Cys-tRNA(Cys) deacylase
MAKKLNSMRLLDQQKISYDALEYGGDGQFHDAEAVADILGVPAHIVYKTLVVEAAGNPKPALAIIAANRVLDLKALAAAMGVKKVAMASQRDAEQWTGLQVGGISALALSHKRWAVYLDRAALDCERILVSAGQRGTQISLAPSDLLRVSGATLAAISRASD